MISITLCYSMDGKNIANFISDECLKSKHSWNFKHYPLVGINDNLEFWNSISNGSLKTDIILFVGTDDFYKNNYKNFNKLRSTTEQQKYRFSWITVGKNNSAPPNIPYDVQIFSNEDFSGDLQNIDNQYYLLSQVTDYLQLVDTAIKRQKEFKEERKTRIHKYYRILLSVFFAYLGIIISAISVIQLGESNHIKSSAELLLIATGFMIMITAMSSFILILNNRKKRIQDKETKDFDRELSLSLSNSSSKKSEIEDILSVANDIISDSSLPTSNTLDLIFTIKKILANSNVQIDSGNTLSYEHNTNKRKPSFIEDTEIAKAIGDDSYLPLGHLKFNWKQMKGYYDISKKQAKTSFAWAIAISFIGILIIVFAILSPLFPCFRLENSLIPIIGSIGGAVVELFAGTILVVYIKSLSQMNLYHKALSGYQQYLSCVNLVAKISSIEKQDQLYEYIIREEMQQKHVIDEIEKVVHKNND